MTKPRLYLIAPARYEATLLSRLQTASAAGDIACVLLPEADPARLGQVIETVQAHGAAALVRNDLRLAREADGVHLEAPAGLDHALRQLSPARIVGVSGLALRDEAMAAGEAGADYVMFGETLPEAAPAPFEERLERVAWWAEIFQVPCVAVAHDPDEIAPLAERGADFVALPAALWAEGQDTARAIRDATSALQDGHAAALLRQGERV